MSAIPRESTEIVVAAGEVRGTQSFVHVLAECWRRPSWTALEILWRWVFGIPVLLVLWREGSRIWQTAPVDRSGLESMTVTDPMGSALTLGKAMMVLLPVVWSVTLWLGPLLLACWVVLSSVGRTLVLCRVDRSLHPRVGTLMMLQAVRIVALAGSLAFWFWCMEHVAQWTIVGPASTGQEPNLVGYCALAIVTTLGLFTLWAVVSWVLAIAPLLTMLQGWGVRQSLTGAFRLGPLKSKLVEINLVMGIVKIALIVLAMVFSATPLPFESVTTPEFLACWWAGVAVLYLMASDFFHVAQQVAYLRLWRAFEGSEKI